MLKVEGLNAGYGSVNILWDIGFEVKDGEIVAILGSNGAGKTTMVRTITGMVKASSGKVEFNGEDLSGKSSRVSQDSDTEQAYLAFICKRLKLNFRKLSVEERKWLKKIAEKSDLLKNPKPQRGRR